jgi:hypothetical protein
MVALEERDADSSRSKSPPAIMKDEEVAVVTEPEWKPTAHELAIMLTLSTTSLMISLDATIVVTTIEVCVGFIQVIGHIANGEVDYRK